MNPNTPPLGYVTISSKDWQDMLTGLRLLCGAVNIVPEFFQYGTWDTPRCIFCGGFKYPGLDRAPGHKPGCLRQKALQSALELEPEAPK